MSRDPLEGVRPSDTFGSSFSPAPPVSREPAGSFPPAASGGNVKVVILIVVSVVAVAAGAIGYFVTVSQTPVTPKGAASSDTIVRQGPAPAVDPSPASAVTPR